MQSKYYHVSSLDLSSFDFLAGSLVVHTHTPTHAREYDPGLSLPVLPVEYI